MPCLLPVPNQHRFVQRAAASFVNPGFVVQLPGA